MIDYSERNNSCTGLRQQSYQYGEIWRYNEVGCATNGGYESWVCFGGSTPPSYGASYTTNNIADSLGAHVDDSTTCQ